MVRKPDNPTKTVTTKNVPSEFAEMFHDVVLNQRREGETKAQTKTRLLVEMICAKYLRHNHNSVQSLEGFINWYENQQRMRKFCNQIDEKVYMPDRENKPF